MYLVQVAIDTYSLIVVDDSGQKIFLGTYSIYARFINGIQMDEE